MNRYAGRSLPALLVSFATLAAGGQSPEAGSAADAAAAFTAELLQWLESTGRPPLTGFECDARPPIETGDIVSCSGTDAAGNLHGLTLLMQADGSGQPRTVSVTASFVPPERLAIVDEVCRATLDAYNAEAWDELVSRLHPTLRSLGEEAVAQYREYHATTGVLQAAVPAHTYTERGQQRELEYALSGSAGRYDLRCGVLAVDEQLYVSGWLLGAPAGSPQFEALSGDRLARQVSALLGQQVRELDLPLERLVRQGDWVESVAVFEDGTEPLPMAVALTGRDDDFDAVDFSVAHLALERVFRMRYPTLQSVSCPQPVVADGGEIECQLRFASGRELSLLARRKAWKHALSAPPLVSRADLGDVAAIEAALAPGLERYLHVAAGDVAALRCDLDSPPAPGDQFDCEAALRAGESLQLLVRVAEDELTPELVTRGPETLEPGERARLEAPCLAWLGAHAREDWHAIIELLTPELRAESSAAALQSQFVDLMGDVDSRTLLSHAVRGGVQDELLYRLQTSDGPWDFRCGLEGGTPDSSGIVAYLLAQTPGSPAALRSVQDSITEALAGTVGEPVQRLDIVLEGLKARGDATQGLLWIDDERSLNVRVEQKGRSDDFDNVDYHYNIIEADFLLRRALAARSIQLARIECPARTAPDGGEIVCQAEVADGTPLEVTLRRTGGIHDMQSRVVER